MSEFWNPEWETKRIGELCDVIDPHPSHRAPEEKQDGIFFLGIGDLSEDGQIIGSKARRVSPDIFFEHQQYRYLSAKLSACDAVRGNIFNINCFPLMAQQQAHEEPINVLFLIIIYWLAIFFLSGKIA